METQKPISLPVQLQPANLRPIAYRILSKKHGLNIQTDSLKILADYIGITYGTNWKSSKAQQFLDDLGSLWKEQGRNLFLDPQGVNSVIKELSVVNDVRQPSSSGHPLKKLELSDIVKTVSDKQDIEIYQDNDTTLETRSDDHKLQWHDFFKVILPKDQPHYKFDPIKKQYEKETSSLETYHIASTNSKLSLYKIRHSIIELRLSRNVNFQQPTFSSLNSLTGSIASTAVTITPIKNLLGRHGQRFVLFGLLTKNESGNYSLEDSTDTIELELSQCIATEGSYYCPGFFVMVEGIYSNSNKFYCSTMGHPPLERRETTLDSYGYIDFMGVHSSTNKTNKDLVSSINGITRIDRALKKNLQILEKELYNHKMIIIGHDCNLNDLKRLESLKKLFNKLNTDLESDQELPVCLIFNGPFTDKPFIASQYNSASISSTPSSTQYKQAFDSLASILENYPLICSKVTMIFVPGDNDPWSSIYNKGTSVMWPQNPIPKLFTTRLNRLVKDCHFVSNPSKLSYLNQEIVILRDDMNSRLKRNSINFNNSNDKETTGLNVDSIVRDTPVPTKILEARKLVKTVLDQGHLSPFLINKRPIIWDKDHYLTLSPLPSVIILNDSTINEFDVTYEGCHVINPGPMMTRNQLNYIEYWPSTMKAEFKQV